jgi:hypothetical protein
MSPDPAFNALPNVTSPIAGRRGSEHRQRRDGRKQPPHAPTVTHILAAVVFDPDPLPFIALMGLGFVIGVAGHVYKSRTAVVTGIGMIFVATLLLPVGIYLGDR